MQIKIRLAEQNDCDDILCWRNDDQARKANFNSEITPYAVHHEWFERSLRDQNRRVYIGLDEAGNKIGVVRLDKRNEHTVEFDINIAPAMRGKGYGTQMIEAACQEFNSRSNRCIFLARVKIDNLASIKAFKKSGFFEIFDYEDANNEGVVALAKYEKKD
ncbi:MAG: GNAT family N-acetyltransferase [Candidatus Margulisiibacteriota bacterium]